jgi:signal peptidase I
LGTWATSPNRVVDFPGNFREYSFREFEDFEGTLSSNNFANDNGRAVADSALEPPGRIFNKPANCQGNASVELACGLAGEVVRNFGEVRLRVFGMSMVPSVIPGDMVLIQRAALEEILPGEIAVFLREERLFVHRVVDRKIMSVAGSGNEELCLITRGDRQRDCDLPVSSSELLGRVICIERDQCEVKVAPNKMIRLTARLLQTSDRVTSLYLLLATFSRTIFLRRAKCQV